MKIFLIILSILCVGASIAMYIIGNDSSHLSELKDFWYVPLPLGLFALIGAFRSSSKSWEKFKMHVANAQPSTSPEKVTRAKSGIGQNDFLL